MENKPNSVEEKKTKKPKDKWQLKPIMNTTTNDCFPSQDLQRAKGHIIRCNYSTNCKRKVSRNRQTMRRMQ